jgi:hypothetical protein
MEIVAAKIATIDSVPLDGSGRYEAYFNRFLAGERASSFASDSKDYRGLSIAQNKLGILLDSGLSNIDAVKVYKTSLMSVSLLSGVTNLGDGSPISAYDALVRKVSDCDSDANVYSAVLDAMGYNSAIIAGNNHADIVVKIGDSWFLTSSGDFLKANLNTSLSDGNYVYAQPTFGPALSIASGSGVVAPVTAVVHVVNGITVRYGKHDYGSNNQAEYDKVMEIVAAKVAAIDSISFGGKYEAYFTRFLAGERASSFPSDSLDYRGLSIAQNKLSILLDQGLSNVDVVKAYKTSLISALLLGSDNPGDGSPKSAYDILVRHLGDCDAIANVYSAVFDSLGYNSAILSGYNHADVVVKLGDSWFLTGNGSFTVSDIPTALASGIHMYAQPTFGPLLSK